jgi:hypothetical protein
LTIVYPPTSNDAAPAAPAALAAAALRNNVTAKKEVKGSFLVLRAHAPVVSSESLGYVFLCLLWENLGDAAQGGVVDATADCWRRG